MNFKNCILVLACEPNSVFLEIFFKSLKKVNTRNPLVLIGSLKILKFQMKKLSFKKKIKILDLNNLKNYKLNNSFINLINVDYNYQISFGKITKKSNNYIEKCFNTAFKIIRENRIKKIINGPINKKTFLNKKFLGITEYISSKFSIKKNCMLIYNKNLSVCPITTHLPLKDVSKKISKQKIIEKAKLIYTFYEKNLDIRPRIAILGLNPHCESMDKFNEDQKIIKPAVNYLKRKKYNVSGPFSADTMFLKDNRYKFDVIIGMYHDQVLTPLKTIFEYDAINITLGLPFLRISPDHGPNEKMLGKNISNPTSLIKAINFLDKLD
tara:strand:+ start:1185 stop:2156 length:972 start_codon:yes stop_codon:yes gene_type:complete